MAQSYKTSISFGLVYIPITLHAVIKNNDIGFNMLHKKTKQRIRYQKTCDGCPSNVNVSDIVKGYEYEPDKYIEITNEEMERLKTKKDETITIEQFCKSSEIDPVFYDKSYYVVPTGAKQAFALLLQAMEEEGKVAIAKVVLGSKETLVSIRSQNGQMILNTMYFLEEVQQNPYGVQKTNNKETELKLAKNIIKSLTKKFEPDEFEDEYRKRLQKAIEEKIGGQEIMPAKQPKTAKVLKLLDALELTLKQNTTSGKPTKSKTATKTKTASKTKPHKELPSNVTKMQKRAWAWLHFTIEP